jgi:LPS export ABC transporter protein LptC
MDRHLRIFAILKWIPRVLIISVIGFSCYVGWSYHNKKTQPPPKPKRPPKIASELFEFQYSHFDQGVMVYNVQAKKNTKLRSNRQELDQPEFTFYDKEGKETVRVTGKTCSISKDSNVITVVNDVAVKGHNGVTIYTRELVYDNRLQQFSSPSPSKFKWRTMNGKAKGFVYEIDNDLLILPEKPNLQYVNRASDNRAPIEIAGERGAINRKTGFAYFDGSVEVTQGRDNIHADRIEVDFMPGGNDVHKITALGKVHVKFARPRGEDTQESSQTGETPQTAPAIQAVPANQQTPGISNVFVTESESGKELDADEVELFFYADGSTIRSFKSKGKCEFTLHMFDQNKPSENRVINGDTFEAEFNSKGDMEKFHAIENVSVRVQPVGPGHKERGQPQTIYCKDLLTNFIPETGDIKEIYFNENFKHVQGQRTVSSQKAYYSGDSKKTDLIGEPDILDATFHITSTSMQLFEQTSAIHAEGNVKSTFTRSEGKTPMTFPFSSPSNQPVYISADKMDWDSQKSEAVYTGKSKLWQEKNVITAAKLVINDREKTLSAYDKVHTIFYNKKEDKDGDKSKKKGQKQKQAEQPQSQSQPSTQKEQPQTQPENKLLATGETTEDGPISVDAEIMNYIEKDRIIHFDKTVKVVTPSTKIDSDKADFYLKKESSEFDRLYAQGNVVIQNEQKRGVGKKATFYSANRKLILEGGPRLSETGKADIVGHILTLFLEDGRILIDGEEDGRASTTLQMQGNAAIIPVKPTKKDVPDAGLKNRKPN